MAIGLFHFLIMKYVVNCTQIYNGQVEVEADSEEEALQKGQEMVCEELVDFQFGEATADFVEPIND